MNKIFEIKNTLVIFFLVVFIIAYIRFILVILKNMIAALKKIFNDVYRNGKKPKRKVVRRWIVNIIARIIAIVVFVVAIITNYRNINYLRQPSALPNEKQETTEVVPQPYLDALKSIPFQSEVIAIEETLWEYMLNEGLMYKEYLMRLSTGSNFAKLRSYYQENSENMVEWPKIDIDKLVNQVKSVYGSELLPTTDYTFGQINAKIASYSDPLKVPADVYKAEFWVRISMGKNGYSPDTLYHIGRAADDVLKVLEDTNKITKKEWLFFGSMAVSFYLASMEHNDELQDLSFTYYRIAEIFIYLNKYSPLKTEESYSRHFRLMAEKALGDAEKMFDDTFDREKIREKTPYLYCYYVEILYDFSKLYPNGEENLVEKCRKYAGKCVMGDEEGKCCTSCRTLLEKLK